MPGGELLLADGLHEPERDPPLAGGIWTVYQQLAKVTRRLLRSGYAGSRVERQFRRNFAPMPKHLACPAGGWPSRCYRPLQRVRSFPKTTAVPAHKRSERAASLRRTAGDGSERSDHRFGGVARTIFPEVVVGLPQLPQNVRSFDSPRLRL